MKNVLLVGDSIRLDYGPYLEKYVGTGIRIQSKEGIREAYENLDVPMGSNGGDSGMVWDFVSGLAENGALCFDCFIFNCGLHDVKHDRKTGKIQIEEGDYEKNLRKILQLMETHRIPTVFINTTPADIRRYPADFSFVRYAEDVIRYNEIADRVMADKGARVIDLYGFTVSLESDGDRLFRDHTHFQEHVIKMQAAYLAGAIRTLFS